MIDASVRFVETATSTNDLLKEWASAGAPDGATVCATRQTAGRGRNGRSWISEQPGNLYVSILCRRRLPLACATLLPLATAVAIVRCLPDGFGIKWPNDILGRDDQKVGGILVESTFGGGRLDTAVVGIGLNLAHAPEGVDYAASIPSLGGPLWRPASFLSILRPALLDAWADMQDAPGSVLDMWRKRSVTLGRRVEVGSVHGIARDVADDGALLVDVGDGPWRPIHAGDVTLERQ